MDVQFDISSIYFGLQTLKDLEEDFISLSSAMNGVTINSGLLSSASLFETAKREINNATNSTIHNLVTLLENSKKILEQYDREAALLFQYYEQGVLTEDGKWTAVPLMNQDDYGDIKYSQGTVKTSGCGITSLCMLASYITGELYTPEDLATIANENGSSNIDRMTYAADLVGLNWTRDNNTSREDLVNYLQEGKMVICLVKSSSHFVLCTGVTEDGQILVNDPYSPFRQESHKDGYDWGELQFSAGSTWVFDPTSNTGSTVVNDKVSVDQTVLDKLAEQGIDLNAMNDVVPENVPETQPVEEATPEVVEEKSSTTTLSQSEQEQTTTKAEESNLLTKEQLVEQNKAQARLRQQTLKEEMYHGDKDTTTSTTNSNTTTSNNSESTPKQSTPTTQNNTSSTTNHNQSSSTTNSSTSNSNTNISNNSSTNSSISTQTNPNATTNQSSTETNSSTNITTNNSEITNENTSTIETTIEQTTNQETTSIEQTSSNEQISVETQTTTETLQQETPIENTETNTIETQESINGATEVVQDGNVDTNQTTTDYANIAPQETITQVEEPVVEVTSTIEQPKEETITIEQEKVEETITSPEPKKPTQEQIIASSTNETIQSNQVTSNTSTNRASSSVTSSSSKEEIHDIPVDTTTSTETDTQINEETIDYEMTNDTVYTDYSINSSIGSSTLADRTDTQLYPTTTEEHNVPNVILTDEETTPKETTTTEDNNSWIPGAIGIATVAAAGIATAGAVKKSKKNNE